MRTFFVVLAFGLLPFVTALRHGEAEPPPSALTAAVVVKETDPRMRAAEACLTRISQSRANEADTVLVRMLTATGFTRSKVIAKEFKDDPERIRFGFEFTSRDLVKSVYWEADCPSTVSEERLASR